MEHPESAIGTVDLASLQLAVELLEAPSLTLKITNALGSPIEAALAKLPESTHASIHHATKRALEKAADIAFASFSKKVMEVVEPAPASDGSTFGFGAMISGRAKGLLSRVQAATVNASGSSDLAHKIAVGVTGAVGGLFGVAAMMVELPASTILMLRSIADIARSEGADLDDPEGLSRQECLTVFALGAPPDDDDAANSAYYASRAALALLVREAGVALAEVATKQAGAAAAGSIFAKVIEAVAARFGIIVTEKFAAQAVPILGAVAGATINTMFMTHFQDVARGHFIIRRLESQYGQERIQFEYTRVRSELKLKGPKSGGLELAKPTKVKLDKSRAA